MRPPRTLLQALGLALAAAPVAAEVHLPAVFGDHMVVQRDAPIRVFGTGEPGDVLRVRLGPSQALVLVEPDGGFLVELEPLPAGGPHALTVSGDGEDLVVEDVLVGEVWLCSGQSNMSWPLELAAGGPAAVESADYPNLRLFEVERRPSETPLQDTTARWRTADPRGIERFSAVGFFFGRELREALDVPIGLIGASFPSTPCEVWVERDWIANTPGLEPLITNMPPIDPSRPPARAGVLWNGMLEPILPFRFRGAVFYQGESNVERAHQYRLLFPTLIEQWRTTWRQGDFPFYFVQIAPYRYAEDFGLHPFAAAELREAQLHALRAPSTGMVVTTDVGAPDDLHPLNKLTVGQRLAAWALRDVHGFDVDAGSPLLERVRSLGSVAIVSFTGTGGALVTSDGQPPTHFTVAGEDGVFHPAQAAITGDRVLVYSAQVEVPVDVRFAWDDDPTPNLFGATGQPVAPFRSDQQPDVTQP